MASVARKSVYADRQASHDLLFKLCKKDPYGQFVEDGKSYNNMWKIKQILEEHPHLVSNLAIPFRSGKTALHVAAETQTPRLGFRTTLARASAYLIYRKIWVIATWYIC